MGTRGFNWFVSPDGKVPDTHAICQGQGDSQAFVPDLPQGEGPFVAPGPNSNLYDPSLSRLAAQMNESVSNVLPSRPEPRFQIGFALTDMGIMLVWELVPTDDEWRDEYASREGLEHMEGKSNNELAEIFDLPWGKGA
jgi:hypothetical protein